ncbi:MAG: beta-N-acetylhexosaminidase [Thermodesulfobacteriota bacterium]
MNPFSKEQIAGQRLMIGFDGTAFNRELDIMIREWGLGGLILFSRNLESPSQIRNLCSAVQDCARSAGQPPLLIAIDQEGGQVARLKEPFTQFAGNPAMQGVTDAEYFGRITAGELSGIGVNMNMAPVLDVSPDGFQGVMDGRIFGKDPHWVASLGGVVIEELQRGGIMAVAKHFPGIGRTTLDSHIETPFVDASLGVLETTDLIPFREAIQRDVAGIMLSHIRYPAIDAEWPASLSAAVASELLRNRMGYGGVIITDDLDMGAIRKHYGIETSIGRIFQADVDIALICHRGPDIAAAHGEMIRQAEQSAAAAEKSAAAVRRILRLKQKYLAWNFSE